MTTNVLNIKSTDATTIFPLRGDMGVTLDFVPSGDFDVTFVTYSTNDFVLTSTTARFRQFDGSIGNTLVIGGGIALFCTLMYNQKDNTWDIGANNLASVSKGSGSGLTPETVIEPIDGVVTPNYSQGNNFFVTLASNTRFANPVGYPEGMDITITVQQDDIGARIASFDTEYAMADAQPIALATMPNAINKMVLHRTKGDRWLTDITPTSTYKYGYGLVTAIAKIGTIEYFAMGQPLGSTVPGAMPSVKNGESIVIVRNGTGPEATGVITGTGLDQVYSIIGKPVGKPGDPDRRPMLHLLPDTRPAYGKAQLDFEGQGTVYVRDIRLSGARNDQNDAHSLCPNDAGIHLIVNNVEITDSQSGILSGNTANVGTIEMYDVVIDKCGFGGPNDDASHGYTSVGFTHGTYFGHNPSTVILKRMSVTNAIQGNNIKCRTGNLFMDQVLCQNSATGREFEFSNGGRLYANNCIFSRQFTGSGINNLTIIGNNPNLDGVEGIDTSRPREYVFTNCRFENLLSVPGRDPHFICCLDPTVPMKFIDCEFIGDQAKTNQTTGGEDIYVGCVTVNGIRYRPGAEPIIQNTGGPLGPILPVGYFPIPMSYEE